MAKPVDLAKKYDQRIALQRQSGSTVVNGQLQPNWTTYRSVHAAVLQITSAEMAIAMGASAMASHLVDIRYYAKVNEVDQILWRGRTLSILGVTNPDGKRVETRIACLEIKQKPTS